MSNKHVSYPLRTQHHWCTYVPYIHTWWDEWDMISQTTGSLRRYIYYIHIYIHSCDVIHNNQQQRFFAEIISVDRLLIELDSTWYLVCTSLHFIMTMNKYCRHNTVIKNMNTRYGTYLLRYTWYMLKNKIKNVQQTSAATYQVHSYLCYIYTLFCSLLYYYLCMEKAMHYCLTSRWTSTLLIENTLLILYSYPLCVG